MATHVTTAEEIGDFVRMWRAHFVASMSPRFLPEGWSVDYSVFPAHYGPNKDVVGEKEDKNEIDVSEDENLSNDGEEFIVMDDESTSGSSATDSE